MIDDLTLLYVQTDYCELYLSDNAQRNGWTLKAIRIVHFGMEKFEEVTFEGKSIADCFKQAADYSKAKGTKASG